MLEIAFSLILVGVLIATVITVVIMGSIQVRRIRLLRKEASRLGMEFSVEDSFQTVFRGRDFDLIRNGHSPHADNVTFGRLEHKYLIRAFDFRYEIGHGTGRITRRYGVLVSEIDRNLPDLLMWHEAYQEDAPWELQTQGSKLDCWQVGGEVDFSRWMVQIGGNYLKENRLSMQTRGRMVMCFSPLDDYRKCYSEQIIWLSQFLDGISHYRDENSPVPPAGRTERTLEFPSGSR